MCRYTELLLWARFLLQCTELPCISGTSEHESNLFFKILFKHEVLIMRLSIRYLFCLFRLSFYLSVSIKSDRMTGYFYREYWPITTSGVTNEQHVGGGHLSDVVGEKRKPWARAEMTKPHTYFISLWKMAEC